MVSKKEDIVDFNKLEEEVCAAMEAEARYYRENDAKFRAINQRVATYEEFRDIVLASHLKPLDKEDRLDKIQWNQPWNQIAATSDAPGTAEMSSHEKSKLYKKPCNGHEFSRDWRRLCQTNPDKYAFLLWLGADDISKIFKSEISFGLLGEIVFALNDQYQSHHHGQICAIMKSLSEVNRFKLSLDFLSVSEKEACRKLFEKLLADCVSDDDLGSCNKEQDCSSFDPETKTCSRSESTVSQQDLLSLQDMYGLETS